MAKNKYYTEYPVVLKEKAKQAGVKIKKSNYRFLDEFMLIQEGSEYESVEMKFLEEKEEITIAFTISQGAVIRVKMNAHEADEICFEAVVKQIPKALTKIVGEQILAGKFIDNHLALQITLEENTALSDNIVLTGKLWTSCHDKDAAGKCSFYLLCFIEEMNQVFYELADKEKYPVYEVHITGYENKVKIIKTIRNMLGLGLKDAKWLVDEVPNAVINAESNVQAVEFCSELRKAGVKAEVA